MRVKVVPGFPNYTVTDDGRVFGVDGYELRQHVNENGYLRAYLYNADGQNAIAVHSVVASAFLGPRPPGYEMRHMDGNKRNNNADNLRWGTSKENAADRVRLGRTGRGRGRTPILTTEEVVDVINRLADGESKGSIARDLGVRQHTMNLAIRRIQRRGESEVIAGK